MDLIAEHGDWLTSQSSWIARMWNTDQQEVYQDLVVQLLAGKPRRNARYLVIHKLAGQKKRQMAQLPDTLDKPVQDQATDLQALAQDILEPVAWQVLQGKVILGHTYAELASQLGLTPDQVRYIQGQALEKVRNYLEGQKTT